MTSNTEIAPTLDSAIQKLVLEVIQDTDLFIVDMRIRGRQGSKVVEVFLDGEAGVSVEQLASISKQLGFLLETEDLIKGKYNLNVSSPGPDKALQIPKQYKRHIGRTIEIKAHSEGKESGPVKEMGELVSASDKEVVLKTDSRENRIFTFEEIEEARIVYPW